MVFSSLYFIFIFLPVVTMLYYVLKLCFPSKLYLRNLLLCLVSLFFYAWGEPVYVLLMLFSIGINYLLALKINKFKLILAVIINLSFLLFFKYLAFFTENINLIFKADLSVPEISLPIGISFYTFQILSYVIDVYRKKIEPQKNLISLALYISFFPQLIAGPIVRYIDIEKELSNRDDSFDNFMDGLKQFILGLGAKVIIANNLATVADGVFGNIFEAGTAILWLAALCYSLQIYFDFSGYSRMAIGLGKIFGFNFPENFNYPYCASSITDFWRRWHITLSVWFRDYVYIPLGGNRVGAARHIFNILLTWLLTGFWHGASWNFMLWGVYYGFLLIFEKYVTIPLLNKVEAKKTLSIVLKVILRLSTLFIVLIGWVLFRIENFAELQQVIIKLFCNQNSTQTLLQYISLHGDLCSKLVFLIPGIIFSMPLYKCLFKKSDSNNFVFAVESIVLFVIFVLSLCLLIASTYNPFIYFRF